MEPVCFFSRCVYWWKGKNLNPCYQHVQKFHLYFIFISGKESSAYILKFNLKSISFLSYKNLNAANKEFISWSKIQHLLFWAICQKCVVISFLHWNVLGLNLFLSKFLYFRYFAFLSVRHFEKGWSHKIRSYWFRISSEIKLFFQIMLGEKNSNIEVVYVWYVVKLNCWSGFEHAI